MDTANVRILPDAPQKYVLASILQEGSDVLFLWGNPDAEWHKHIVEEIEKEFIVANVLGGGWVMLDPDTKTIYLWGTSDRYGLAPAHIVNALLMEAFPEWVLSPEEPPQK